MVPQRIRIEKINVGYRFKRMQVIKIRKIIRYPEHQNNGLCEKNMAFDIKWAEVFVTKFLKSLING